MKGLSKTSRVAYGAVSMFLAFLLIPTLIRDHVSPIWTVTIAVAICLAFLALFSLIHAAIRHLFFRAPGDRE
jgi:hypothetical protein